MSKIKVIVKRPDEPVGHMTNISNNLANLQNTVGGNIEVVHIGESLLLICNEEGKIYDLPKNFNVAEIDSIVGTAIICGEDGCEFADVPISLNTWKLMLAAWGN